MILVDSSIWITYLNRKTTEETNELDRLMLSAKKKIAVADVIITEVLQGARNEKIYEDSKNTLLLFKVFSQNELKIYINAADIYRTCRNKGLTICSTVDTLIASICLENNLELFTLDRDFLKIAKVVPLKLYNF